MDIKYIFEMEQGEYRVPVSKELYAKNLEYFKGMGLYTEETCCEKALLTTGFRVIRSDERE